jgi:hypothetical protein
MKRILLSLIALMTAATVATAEVKDGEKYKCGPNGTVTVSCSLNPTVGTVDIPVSHGGNDSPTVTGTPGASGGNTCDASPSMSVPGGPTFRVEPGTGKAQYKNDKGEWVDCGGPRKNSFGQLPGNFYLTAGDTAPHDGILNPGGDITSLPLQAGETAPYDGWFFATAGEEVTSL